MGHAGHHRGYFIAIIVHIGAGEFIEPETDGFGKGIFGFNGNFRSGSGHVGHSKLYSRISESGEAVFENCPAVECRILLDYFLKERNLLIAPCDGPGIIIIVVINLFIIHIAKLYILCKGVGSAGLAFIGFVKSQISLFLTARGCKRDFLASPVDSRTRAGRIEPLGCAAIVDKRSLVDKFHIGKACTVLNFPAQDKAIDIRNIVKGFVTELNII